MASKRDQLQSYQFLLQRMQHALVLRDTDPEQPPFRRAVQAGWGGLAIAVLSLVAVWVFALIHPGGTTSWTDGRSIIVEKESGARYVFKDGVLYPVANLTSARLVIGQNATITSVPASSLGSVPRGHMIGIDGAPDSLPTAQNMLPGTWTSCSVPGVNENGSAIRSTELMLGAAPAGGTAMREQALLVVSGASRYLVWHGYKHLLSDTATTTAGLLLTGQTAITVGSSWLDLVPAGPAIGPIRPTGIGAVSKVLGGSRVGQVYVARSSAGQTQYYLVEASQLRPISQMQFDIQRAWSQTRRAYPGRAPAALPLDPARAARAKVAVVADAGQASAPTVRPDFVRADAATASACAVYTGPGGVPSLLVGPSMPTPSPAAKTSGTSTAGLPVADEVMVPPGYGTVVRAMSAPDAPSGALYLVTDQGKRFALPDVQTLQTLGLSGVTPVALPAALLARVPAGPALDPDSALRPA